ncbi:putative polysaccharide biosynthesis protein [Selenomonas sputigena]|uniref:Polysaccharide biosynthesis protein n=1 Tax=Selenomonas sputigena (strain ATCC 35185 / DSM 20758 / CCUG 44933 / VPI D19B-28) TaxID=546271 RepID=C9LU45_SELS3|nr:polysaccharide biosynthesis protein [Selenomonas sputigena]AEC00327.1 polysaccharide biosynthesis protein [Selenomonas sputigena ATCC 35185]EEX77576.1 putative stage V sporulation protein B [Selenomonas sputigena ATCC 35185]
MFRISSQKSTGKSKAESFLKGTLILTVASFVVKVIGSLNWIFVSRILGGEGIGLYQMAFPIYFFAMSISQAGVPVAISIITAERVALKDVFGARRVFRISMTLMVFTGLLFSLLTYFGAGWLIEWQFIRDPRAYMAVVALSPTIFFVTLLASSRGYLQGWQRMTPTAVSQIVEQIFRVLTMVLFASLLLPMGLDYAAAGASLGAFAGAIGGLLVLVYYHWKLDKDIEREYGPNLAPPQGEAPAPLGAIVRRIFSLALPVSAASIMLPIVSNLDLLIVPQRLEVAGYTVPQATELFGYLTGMAVPLVNLATILTASLAVSIVPAISEARALKDTQRVYNQTAAAVRISNFVCFPAFVVVFVLATPISTLIYNAPGAGPAVLVSSFSIVLLGLHQVSTAVLQGLGHPKIPMINMILAAAVKVALNWILTAIPWLGIMGAAWATAADMGVAAVINLYFIGRYIGYRMELLQLFKTMAAAAFMAGAVYLFYSFVMSTLAVNAVATFGSVFVGVIVYVAALILVRGLLEEDMARIPFIGSLSIRFLRRIGIFRSVEGAKG